MYDLVQIGFGHGTFTEKQLKIAVLLPKLKVLPRQRGVVLRDGKSGLPKTVRRRDGLGNGPSAAICHYRGAHRRIVVGSFAARAMDRKWLCPTIFLAS